MLTKRPGGCYIRRPPSGARVAICDLVVAFLGEQELASRNRVIEVLQSRGAVSPATARSLGELHVSADDTWNRLVIEGRVREGHPGLFYLFERPRASTRQRLVKLLVFYALIVLIPIVLILANRRGH
jgi:hypothetical protein